MNCGQKTTEWKFDVFSTYDSSAVQTHFISSKTRGVDFTWLCVKRTYGGGGDLKTLTILQRRTINRSVIRIDESSCNQHTL